MIDGEGRQKEEQEEVVLDMGEPNLACHPVWAVLPKAQGRRDSAYNFVHLLIMDPTTEKNTSVFSCWSVQLGGPKKKKGRTGSYSSGEKASCLLI